MTFDLEQVEQLLDGVCLDMMLISTDNLVEISGVIGRLAPLAQAFSSLDSDLPGKVIQNLEDGLTSVIRGEINDSDQALTLVGEGLRFLQEMARSLPVGAPFKDDVDGWARKLVALVDAPADLGDEAASIDEGDIMSGEVMSDEAMSGEVMSDDMGEIDPSSTHSAEMSENLFPNHSHESCSGELAPPGQEKDARVCPVESGEILAADRTCDYDDSASLSLEDLRQELITEVEKLKILIQNAPPRGNPQTDLQEIVRSFRALLGVASLLEVEDMAQLAFNSRGLVEYISEEQIPFTTMIRDLLLRTCQFFLSGIQGWELIGSGWRIKPDSYSPAELLEFDDELWMTRQGIMPQELTDNSATDDSVIDDSLIDVPEDTRDKTKLQSTKIEELLVDKGLINASELSGLFQAQGDARKITLGKILQDENLITSDDLDEALKEQLVSPGQRLGEILVSLGMVSEEQIDQAICSQAEKREIKLSEFLAQSKIEAPEQVAIALRVQKNNPEGVNKGKTEAVVAAQLVKVETTKLDGLIDLVGELVIAQSLVVSSDAISELKEHKMTKDMAHVSRITSELQRNAMRLRMVQISRTFRKMNRLVRDLSLRFGKDVRLETTGEDTDVDRSMVEAIFDPLVHLVRNSMDHGLETPEERLAAGKPAMGLLHLSASYCGGSVVIELSDDGRGVDLEKVLEKAQKQGLVSPGEILSEAAIHNLIFQPGFSTAASITEISGRGVGLDVVRKSIEKLRGKVDFTSVQGQGSTMTIRLPLTLAIIDGMIIRVGEHRYVLPTISITESFRPVPDDYFTVKNKGEMIRVRKELLPLIRLDSIVGAVGATANPEEALVVVVESGGEKRCLLVDEVLGKQEVVIKPLGDWLKHIRALAGGTILGDGRVGLILDVAGLLEVSNDYGGGSPGEPDSFPDSKTDEWDMSET